MKLEKQVACQQVIIDNLTAKNKELSQRVEDLEAELLFEQNKVNLGYEKAGQMIKEMEEQLKEQSALIAELKQSRDELNKAKQDVLLIKKKYQKEAESLAKKLTKQIRK